MLAPLVVVGGYKVFYAAIVSMQSKTNDVLYRKYEREWLECDPYEAHA